MCRSKELSKCLLIGDLLEASKKASVNTTQNKTKKSIITTYMLASVISDGQHGIIHVLEPTRKNRRAVSFHWPLGKTSHVQIGSILVKEVANGNHRIETKMARETIRTQRPEPGGIKQRYEINWRINAKNLRRNQGGNQPGTKQHQQKGYRSQNHSYNHTNTVKIGKNE